MNERIKELAQQAGFQYIKDEGIGWAGNYNASLPKFAELIVRECANVCESMDRGHYKEVQDATLKDASVKIKEHFGVEQ